MPETDPVADMAADLGVQLRRRTILAPVMTAVFLVLASLFMDVYVMLGSGLILLGLQYWFLLRPLHTKVARFARLLGNRNRELRTSLATVEQNTESRTRLLAGMSHEIRTPLNGIVGFSDFLLVSTLDRQQQEYAQTIQLCSKHLLSILDGLMDFSRLELAKLKLNVQPANGMEVVEEALQMLAPMAYGKGLELWNLVDPELDQTFLVDADRLRQVLVNLITNGVKFTAQGHVKVQGNLARDAQDRPLLSFQVSDTGPGIPVDVQGQLFEPFRQMDVSVTRRYGGSGLGLAICKGLVELMDGTIACLSEIGQGARFDFTVVAEPTPVSRSLRLKTPSLQVNNCPELLRSSLEKWCAYWSLPIASDGFPLTFSEGPPAEGIWACPLTPGPTRSTLPRLPRPYRWTQLRQHLDEVLTAVPEAPTTSVEGLEILVVEDNSVNRKVLCTMLERMGEKVESVVDGQLALDMLEKRMFPVIFMDLAMPVLDGFGCTLAIRERYPDPAHPWIIACTAQATAEDRERAFQVGMNDFIAKPLQKEKLIDSLARRG